MFLCWIGFSNNKYGSYEYAQKTQMGHFEASEKIKHLNFNLQP